MRAKRKNEPNRGEGGFLYANLSVEITDETLIVVDGTYFCR
jgi:hypothetical protein